MADILCPHCGMPNPSEQNVCSFCRQQLREPEPGDWIRPGDAPTKKTTAELESILPDWLRDAREKARRAETENANESQAPAETPAPKNDVPDWLAGLESASREDQDDEIPEWMRGAPSSPAMPPAKPASPEPTFSRRQEIRWGDEPGNEMGGMATTPVPSAPQSGDAMLPWMNASQPEPSEGREKDDLPGWLASSEEKPPVSPFAGEAVQPPSTGELTDWLAQATSEAAATPAPKSDDSLDDWLSNLPRDATPLASEKSDEAFDAQMNLPDWMKPSTAANEEKRSAPPQEEKAAGAASTPDWMASFRETEPPAHLTESAPEVPYAPAFVPGQEPSSSSQADELFSIEMPDWLSNIAPTEQKSAPAAPQNETTPEAISPADLPSWVQAMRPVETALPTPVEMPPPAAEGPLEEKGPLAGLRGVLPLEELVQPGKPKAQGLRLQASQGQQSNATMLEQMLAAEMQAKPIRGGGTLASQRVLRWVITGVLVLLAVFFLASGSQIVPLPAALSEESNLAMPVLDSLPEGAPVLMIFDYEPALVGELESAAAPFVDRVIGLRHPRVTILSTSPTGAILAERFFADTQSRHDYKPGQNYINLGYLPGGTTGILSFAENPRAAMPQADWGAPPAQDVNRFSDYAAILLLTDQAETARAWVEQTTAYRNGRPFLVVSSAQAAPMIQPYLISGQVNGLVSGFSGGAAFEAAGGTGSLVRRYWDAYNITTLFAALLILVGALWNFIVGVRSHRQGLDEV